MSKIEINEGEHKLITQLTNMKKSYDKLKQRFNLQAPSAEIPPRMVEEGHRWCKGMEGRKERGGKYS